jgi:hypothetical protein
MFIIPIIAGLATLVGIVSVGGTFYCIKPKCCQDNEFIYLDSDYSDFEEYW